MTVVSAAATSAGHRHATVRLNGSVVETFPVPGFFTRVLTLPAGALGSSAAYQPLDVTSIGELSLEQFDAQPPGVPMFAYDHGWHEPGVQSCRRPPGGGRASARTSGSVPLDGR